MPRSLQSPVDVCLISAGLPSSNPRLVKEAAALTGEGYSVHCIVGDYATPLRVYDEQLLRQAGASFTRVGLGTRWSYRGRRVAQLLAQRSWSIIKSQRWLGRAVSTQTGLLLRAALRIPAKLYIGHTLPALPAAVWAAESTGASAGFDAEDLHSGETGDPFRDGLALRVEREFLPRCQHLTASAPLIAAEYRQRHGVEMTTVLNAFPMGESISQTNFEVGPPWSAYWFSQTIGPGRGIEEVIVGLAMTHEPVTLSLRGVVREEYRERLLNLAAAQARPVSVSFLPPGHPDDMIPLAAAHHVGLSVELSTPANHDLCLANKVFTWLAAGIPQLMSRTQGHCQFAPHLGSAAELVDIQNPREVAAALDRIFHSPADHQLRCTAAHRLARDKYCWQAEQVQLLERVRGIVGKVRTPQQSPVAVLGQASG